MTLLRTSRFVLVFLGLTTTSAGLHLAAAQNQAQPQTPRPVATADVTAANAVAPGELLIEPPTLINLGFEWFVQGDDNRNAAVAVSFRKRTAQEWKPALPPEARCAGRGNRAEAV